MKTLTNLRQAVITESRERQEKAVAALESETALERYSTPTRWANYQAGKASREDTVCYAINRINRAIKKEADKKMAAIAEAEQSSAQINETAIIVEYIRSRTWGYNPQVTAQVTTTAGYKEYHGSASGCRYDKTSAAVASALNQDPTLRAYLYRAKEERLANGLQMPYGSGYGALPYIESATGMPTVESVLNACGLGLVNETETKNTALYIFAPKNFAHLHA